VYASSEPPSRSSASAISRAVRRSVPLNTMCSRRWLTPISSADSYTDPAWTHTPTAAERTPGISSVRTTSPSPRSARAKRSASKTPSERGLAGQPQPPLLVDGEQLDARHVSLLEHIFGPLRPTFLELRDVHQPLHARQDLHEGAERRGALHHTLVDSPDLSLLHDRLDHLARPLAAFH